MAFERALVAFAHPDDAEFLCGGTVAQWVREGTDVVYVCATDGSAGWNGPDRSREEIARIREEEMREAASVLGVTDVAFLGYTDGSLEPNLELRRAVTRHVRRARPNVLVTFDPSKLWFGRSYINHPDHRAIGQAVLDVVVCDAPTRPQFPDLVDEGLEPFSVPELWLATEPSDADARVDIGETMDLKMKAIRAHRSQLENMGDTDWDARIREWGSAAAEGGMEFAEPFRTFRLEA
ncbi:MAG TPA: PIG-L deacetylase family protein [Actinomycetota bacterium]|nr:PIG-L deacetylase family protein [Actinomycetota bacterium]